MNWTDEEDYQLRLAVGLYEEDFRSIKKFLKNTRTIAEIKARLQGSATPTAATPAKAKVSSSTPKAPAAAVSAVVTPTHQAHENNKPAAGVGPPSAFVGSRSNSVINIVSTFNNNNIPLFDFSGTTATNSSAINDNISTLVKGRIQSLQQKPATRAGNLTPSRKAAVRARKVTSFVPAGGNGIVSAKTQSVASSKMLFESLKDGETSSSVSTTNTTKATMATAAPERRKVKSKFLGNESPTTSSTATTTATTDIDTQPYKQVEILKANAAKFTPKGSPRQSVRSSNLRNVISASDMETANDTFVTPPSITAKKSSLSSSSGLTPEAAIPVAGRKRRNDDQGDNIMEAHVEEEIKATRQAKRAKRGLSSSPAAFNQLPIVAPAAEKVAVKWDEAVLAASAAAASTLSTKKKKMSGRVLSPMPNKKGGARGASSIKTLVIEDEGITVAKKTALAKAVAVVAAAASEEDSSDDEGFSSAGEEEEEEEFSDDDDEEEGEEERKAGWLTSVLSKLSFRFMG